MNHPKSCAALYSKPLPALPIELKKFGHEGLEVVDKHVVVYILTKLEYF